MTYKDAFVVEVKCKGKILRMRDDFVYLPFGSEYSIYLKNLSSKKASVKIHIDGQDVLDYSSLILAPNTSTELEGFLSGSVARNKFKFIKKTKEIQDHRGDKIDDGMIRVEFAYEIPQTNKRTILHEHHDYYYPKPFHWNYDGFVGDVNNVFYSSNISDACSGDNSKFKGQSSVTYNDSDMPLGSCEHNVTMTSLGIESLGTPLDDEGITVKGHEINQQFRYGSIGELDPPEAIIIRMKGIDDTFGVAIQAPLTIQSKLTCSSCGKIFKSSFKYCPNCGTYLE